jgi:hypothetical protein
MVIDEALKETVEEQIALFKKGKISRETTRSLNAWVSSNIDKFTNNEPSEASRLDLGKWYIIWITFFPAIDLPVHPCKCHRPSLGNIVINMS